MQRFIQVKAVVFALIAFVSASCANSASTLPSELPSPSVTSRAAVQACNKIKSEIPGLRVWMLDVNNALDDIPVLSGLEQYERIAANNLLVLHYEFYPEMWDAIMERAPDIRQQGRGCIESFDQILNAYRGIPVAAVQILTCSLNQGMKAVWANESCFDINASWNVANNSVRALLKSSEDDFEDPTSEFLQSLRPWQPPADSASSYESYLLGSEAETCETWAGVYDIDARVLISLLEQINNAVYPDILPTAPGASTPLPENALTTTTRTLYYGSSKKQKDYKDAIFQNFGTAAVAPLLPPRTFMSTEPKVQSLELDKICNNVNAKVDKIGRAAGDKLVPGSAGDGLIARAYEGYAFCGSGKFGSDIDACFAKRLFGVIPLLINEWQELRVAVGELSWFIMIAENGVLPEQ